MELRADSWRARPCRTGLGRSQWDTFDRSVSCGSRVTWLGHVAFGGGQSQTHYIRRKINYKSLLWLKVLSILHSSWIRTDFGIRVPFGWHTTVRHKWCLLLCFSLKRQREGQVRIPSDQEKMEEWIMTPPHIHPLSPILKSFESKIFVQWTLVWSKKKKLCFNLKKTIWNL